MTNLPVPRRIPESASFYFELAGDQIRVEFRRYKNDAGFLFFGEDGTRLWRSIRGKGDWTWKHELIVPIDWREAA